MLTTNFQIDGPIMAYYRTRNRGSKFGNPRAKRYDEYKRLVRLIANTAGVPQELLENHRASVSVWITWRLKARADTDSILKAIIDALWRQDRRVHEVYAVAMDQTKMPERASVVVKLFKA